MEGKEISFNLADRKGGKASTVLNLLVLLVFRWFHLLHLLQRKKTTILFKVDNSKQAFNQSRNLHQQKPSQITTQHFVDVHCSDPTWIHCGDPTGLYMYNIYIVENTKFYWRYEFEYFPKQTSSENVGVPDSNSWFHASLGLLHVQNPTKSSSTKATYSSFFVFRITVPRKTHDFGSGISRQHGPNPIKQWQKKSWSMCHPWPSFKANDVAPKPSQNSVRTSKAAKGPMFKAKGKIP